MYKKSHTELKLIFNFGLALAMTFGFLAGAQEKSAYKWSGDLRYRHEQFRVDGDQDRFRDRIRARVALEMEIEENWKAFLRLSTGEAGSTGQSSNQTLSDGGEGKAVWLSWGYLQWNPTPQVEARLGKMANMWWQPAGQQYVFDEDYTPEGLSGQWTNAAGNHEIFVNGHAHWLKERSAMAGPTDTTDAGMLGVQGGFKMKNESGKQIVTALGAYQVTNLRGRPSLRGAGTSFGGNSASGAPSGYGSNFSVAVASIELDCATTPLKLGAQLSRNMAIGKRNQGGQVTAQWNKVKAKGDWQASYSIRYTERDALLAAFTDDDVAGPLDSRGQIFQAKYGVGNNVTAAATYYWFDYNLTSNSQRDSRRLQLDLVAKF